AQPAQAPRRAWDRDLRRPLVSHEPVGLSVHGRRRLRQSRGLRDKRVAIIGSGASAVQSVPHVGESAKHLYVFQRTPSSIDVRANRPTDPAWVKTLGPGWQKRRMENFSALTAGGQAEEDLVMDGWTEIIGKLLLGRSGNG